EAPRARGELRDREAAGFVDVEGSALELARGFRELRKFGVVDFAAADARGRNLDLLGKNTGGELLGRHFERKEADDAAGFRFDGAVRLRLAEIFGGDVVGDVGGERG